MLRGIGGKSIFNDNQDRARFCLILQEAAECHGQRIHAFCLMSNHLHLIVEPTAGPLKDGIHGFAFRYAQYFNRRYKHRGYLFQGRFRSILVEDGLYLRRLIRYIHLNPVEACLVSRPDEYAWSSHNAYFGAMDYTWLVTDRILSLFGQNRSDSLIRLSEFINQKIDAERDIEDIQKASRLGVYGTNEFVRLYAPEVSLQSEKIYAQSSKLSFDEILKLVCVRFDLSFEQLRGSCKAKSHVDGRAVLARACQLVEGSSLGDICRALEKHHGTVSRLAAKAANTAELTKIVEELLYT
jgi:REP element-mobilizing transposase RayT